MHKYSSKQVKAATAQSVFAMRNMSTRAVQMVVMVVVVAMWYFGRPKISIRSSIFLKPELIAENGQGGSKRNRRGRSGEPLVVKVPMGTLVRRDGIVVADLIVDGQEAVVARGGDGGFGNAHFKSSTRQAPRIGELGEPGDEFEAQLELKLLADVGLVGFPNAGKSTFLSVVSNARPEIANYEFTTLTPNLGRLPVP